MQFGYASTTCAKCGRKHSDEDCALVTSVGDAAMTLVEAQLALRRDAPRPGIHEEDCPCRWCKKNKQLAVSDKGDT